MDFSLVAIWHSMSPLARGVAGLLVIMATAALAVFLERVWYFMRSNGRSKRFAEAADQPMQARDWARVAPLAKDFPGSALAELVSAGVAAFVRGRAEHAAAGAGIDPVELAKRALGRKREVLAAELRRGFGVLATVSSVAPFVGLFGTVVGIISAFEGIARTGAGGLGSVSAGIAEALVVTALGLGVAIPAVLGFNFLSTRADRVEVALSVAAGELVDHLEQGHTADRAPAGRTK